MGASNAVSFSEFIRCAGPVSSQSAQHRATCGPAPYEPGMCLQNLQVCGVDMIIMGFGYAMLCLRWSLRACAARLRLDAEPGVSNGGEC